MPILPGGPVVLSFSHEFSLLLTRQWLLERCSCRVLCAMSKAEFRQRLCQTRVDLVILCQTLTAEECQTTIEFVKEHSPDTRCIMMYSTQPQWMPEDHSAFLDSAEGPVGFTRIVQESLSQMLPAARPLPATAQASQVAA